MRIAFVTFEYPPFIIGGAGVYALNITHELAKLGHQIIVFVPDIPGIKYDKHFKNIVFKKVKINNKLPFNALQYWLNLPAEVKKTESENKFDIIHFNGISYWFLKKRISRAPHVLTVHHSVMYDIGDNHSSLKCFFNFSGENSFFIPLIEKRCIMSADKIVAVSNFTKEQILSNYNINPQKIEMIYNGINSNKLNFENGDFKSIVQKFNLSSKPIVLFVGRVDDPRKGLLYLINAFKNVIKEVDCELVVVGKGDQTKAKNLSDSLNISKNIIFTGFLEDNDLQKFYFLCDIYVCPSLLEGFGLTLVEAMAAGKPIIANNSSAIPEIIGDAGVLINSLDPELLARSIASLLKDDQNRKCLGIKAHKRFIQQFSWSVVANKLLDIYRNICCNT
jgi:glycosyltransferase involved in cell wall biosynthesis